MDIYIYIWEWNASGDGRNSPRGEMADPRGRRLAAARRLFNCYDSTAMILICLPYNYNNIVNHQIEEICYNILHYTPRGGQESVVYY